MILPTTNDQLGRLSMIRNLFLTGRIKCGKSTLIKQEITPFLDDIGGYYVQRVFLFR
jgi:hypothetical protein